MLPRPRRDEPAQLAALDWEEASRGLDAVEVAAVPEVETGRKTVVPVKLTPSLAASSKGRSRLEPGHGPVQERVPANRR